MQWQALIEFLGGATAISLTIGFLGKKAIDAFLAGRVAEYKSNLEKIATEHSIRFSSLHSRRAEVIAEIYELLSVVENQSRILATPLLENGEPPKNITYKNTASSIYQLYEKFNKTRIYFPEHICQLIDGFINQSQLPINFYRVVEQVSKQDPEAKQEELQKDLQKKAMEVWEEVENKVPDARRAIEVEFRNILGVSSRQNT